MINKSTVMDWLLATLCMILVCLIIGLVHDKVSYKAHCPIPLTSTK